MIRDVYRLGFGGLWERLRPYLLGYQIPLLMRVEIE